MSTPYMHRKVIESGIVALDGTGDVFTLTPGQPINIVRWGIIPTTLLDVGASFAIKADFRPTAGSDSGRGDGDVGDISTTVDTALGAGDYTEAVAGDGVAGSKVPFQVDPGEQVVFQVTDAADTTGDGVIFVEYEEHPFVGDPNATAGSFSNRISNMISND